jgi:hypothetical protein
MSGKRKTKGKRKESQKRNTGTQKKVSENQRKKGWKTHPINNQHLTTYVLARLAGQEYDWAREICWVAPPPSWDTLVNLAQTRRVGEEVLIPTKCKYMHPISSQPISIWVSAEPNRKPQ